MTAVTTTATSSKKMRVSVDALLAAPLGQNSLSGAVCGEHTRNLLSLLWSRIERRPGGKVEVAFAAGVIRECQGPVAHRARDGNRYKECLV